MSEMRQRKWWSAQRPQLKLFCSVHIFMVPPEDNNYRCYWLLKTGHTVFGGVLKLSKVSIFYQIWRGMQDLEFKEPSKSCPWLYFPAFISYSTTWWLSTWFSFWKHSQVGFSPIKRFKSQFKNSALWETTALLIKSTLVNKMCKHKIPSKAYTVCPVW